MSKMVAAVFFSLSKVVLACCEGFSWLLSKQMKLSTLLIQDLYMQRRVIEMKKSRCPWMGVAEKTRLGWPEGLEKTCITHTFVRLRYVAMDRSLFWAFLGSGSSKRLDLGGGWQDLKVEDRSLDQNPA